MRGEEFEERAAQYLASKGYKILYRNWRRGRYEIDIVALRGKTLVFVEVKGSGVGGSVGHLLSGERVNWRKLRALRIAVNLFLAQHPKFTDYDLRVDLITVTPDDLYHVRTIELEGW